MRNLAEIREISGKFRFSKKLQNNLRNFNGLECGQKIGERERFFY